MVMYVCMVVCMVMYVCMVVCMVMCACTLTVIADPVLMFNHLLTGHHGCGKLYWGQKDATDEHGCHKADTYNHYYSVFHAPSEHTIDKVPLPFCGTST